ARVVEIRRGLEARDSGLGARGSELGVRDSGLVAEKIERRTLIVCGAGLQPCGSNGADDLRDLARTEDHVDLRNFLLQLVAIALRQATGDDEAPALTVLLVLRHLENRVDRFLLGRIDERAGIDDEDVGL